MSQNCSGQTLVTLILNFKKRLNLSWSKTNSAPLSQPALKYGHKPLTVLDEIFGFIHVISDIYQNIKNRDTVLLVKLE